MKEFRHRCLARETLVGAFAAIPHPVAVEVLALAGPDFLCIDWEHSQMGRDTVEAMLRAADCHRVPAIVRVPGHAPEPIAAALDGGAAGVLVPRVSTAAQAAAAVKAIRYPPAGERGVGPGRASGYGYRIFDHLAVANDRTLAAVQVETAEGLANAAAIAATEGIDLVFIGPGDLSVSIGALGAGGAARLAEAIDTVIAAARGADKPVGIFCATPEDARRWLGRGVSLVILSSDAMFLGGAAGAAFEAARDRDRTT